MSKALQLIAVVILLVSCTRDPERAFISEVVEYNDFSTVAWNALSEKFDRSNSCDWGEAIEKQIVEEFPMEIACNFWHHLQNARTDFHQKSLSLRVSANATTIEALDHTEAQFDTVFVRCITQEYYLRLLPDMYNEVMKPAIEELIIVLSTKQ